MLLAPGIMQYDFSEVVASNILRQAKDLEGWEKSKVMNEGTQPIRTSYESNFHGVFDSINVKFVYDHLKICLQNYSSLYTFCKIGQDEGIGILKYTEGGWYDTHADASWQTYRILSMLVYLNPQDYEGGETWFPHFDIKIKPEKPALVLFPSNYVYEHQAMPVTGGEKFVLTSWLNDLPAFLHSRSLDYAGGVINPNIFS